MFFDDRDWFEFYTSNSWFERMGNVRLGVFLMYLVVILGIWCYDLMISNWIPMISWPLFEWMVVICSWMIIEYQLHMCMIVFRLYWFSWNYGVLNICDAYWTIPQVHLKCHWMVVVYHLGVVLWVCIRMNLGKIEMIGVEC